MMTRCLLCCAWLTLFLNEGAVAQSVASFEVEVADSLLGLDLPLQVDLDAVTFLPDSSLRLVEVRPGGPRAVPHQIEQGRRRMLHWVLGGETPPGTHTYALLGSDGAGGEAPPEIRVAREGGSLVIRTDEGPLVAYRYETALPHDTVDAVFARSGFIHPLWSPRGQVLTEIQPPGHVHHYGIWNPWTRTEFEGEIVDFWNLGEGEATVRFAGLLSREDGPVYSEIRVLHEHVVFRPDGGETVAMNEVQSVRVYRPLSDDHYVMEIVSELSPAGKSPLRLLTYRYGGMTWRATAAWTKENTEVLTSEGYHRNEADSTRARWFVAQGEVDGQYAGAVLMSHPTNYNHPEPVRIWPDDLHERGELMANFSPKKNRDWLLLPGNRYVLRYRFVVFDGRLGAARADRAWQHFAYPPPIMKRR